MPKGIVGGIMILIALGLILRFGKSSNQLLGTGVTGVNSLINSLAMSGTPGSGL